MNASFSFNERNWFIFLVHVCVKYIIGGRERVAAGGAGGHGEKAGGRPRQARSHGGGETTLALHGGGESLCSNT